jgi:hypothetical protein
MQSLTKQNQIFKTAIKTRLDFVLYQFSIFNN